MYKLILISFKLLLNILKTDYNDFLLTYYKPQKNFLQNILQISYNFSQTSNELRKWGFKNWIIRKTK
jgi:hypothetical protein